MPRVPSKRRGCKRKLRRNVTGGPLASAALRGDIEFHGQTALALQIKWDTSTTFTRRAASWLPRHSPSLRNSTHTRGRSLLRGAPTIGEKVVADVTYRRRESNPQSPGFEPGRCSGLRTSAWSLGDGSRAEGLTSPRCCGATEPRSGSIRRISGTGVEPAEFRQLRPVAFPFCSPRGEWGTEDSNLHRSVRNRALFL